MISGEIEGPALLRRLAAGGAVLAIISLYPAYEAVSEMRNRSTVLEHGCEAQARVVGGAGIESVLIEWADESGKSLRAESRTGKPFARTSSGATVSIRYDPQLTREPVILSQVQERERVNFFWLWSSLVATATGSLVGAVAIISSRRRRPSRW